MPGSGEAVPGQDAIPARGERVVANSLNSRSLFLSQTGEDPTHVS